MDLDQWLAANDPSWDPSAFDQTPVFAKPFGDIPSEDTTMPSSSRSAPESSSTSTQPTPRPTTRALSSLSKQPPGACYNGVVTIEVGSEKKAFVIHKDLLTFDSDYFCGAFDGSFKEAAEGKLSLPDEQVNVFDIFNQFIYTRSLEEHNLNSHTLIELWLFGDKFLIPCLQNAAMDALVKWLGIYDCPAYDVRAIWKRTMPSAPLRKLILDLVVYWCEFENVMSSAQLWSREALVDFSRAFYHKEANGDERKLTKREKCYYHIHAEGEKC
ncbi:unnamed protein product [Aureobasidium vineae]|uniref:BTB domain-containing protein n=1 Tax=Aureobasidium vineae TaxID=2773715 RepID=A0A9N8P9F2_9PEZI|nr:unnamed protein product [Aureobasidium vineae]